MAEKGTLLNLMLDITTKFKKKLSYEMEGLCDELSFREMHIIEFIGKDKKIMSEIADDLNLTPGTLTPIIDKLVLSKYLKRERDEKIDRRKIFISLDKKGSKIFNVFLKNKLCFADSVLQGLEKSDQDVIIGFFKLVSENLDKEINKIN